MTKPLHEASTSAPLPTRGLRAGTRAILLAFTALTALATNLLFVLSTHTENLFAWTIEPPLSAAFVGAGYAAGCLLMIQSLQAKHWADVRLAVVTVLIFTVLTLTATLFHLRKFHFHAGGLAECAAWFWLGVYIVAPIALATTVAREERLSGTSCSRSRSMPRWLRVLLAFQGLTILGTGLTLFVHPAAAGTLWPWTLTPLTAQMTAAWLIAFGAAAVLALMMGDLRRLRTDAVAYAAFAGLQSIAVLRFHREIDWHSLAAAVYLVTLASVVLAGVAGWRLSPVRR